MGCQKLLLPWGNKPIILHLIEVLQSSFVDQILVIIGKDDRVQKALNETRKTQIEIIQNPNAERGMLTSVRAGLHQIDASSDAFMVVLGDQPSIHKSLINGLIDFWKSSPKKMARPIFEGRGGHPLIVPIAFSQAVFCEFEEVGLKGLIRSFPDQIREWHVSDMGVISDIDTPEDLIRERARIGIDHKIDDENR